MLKNNFPLLTSSSFPNRPDAPASPGQQSSEGSDGAGEGPSFQGWPVHMIQSHDV